PPTTEVRLRVPALASAKSTSLLIEPDGHFRRQTQGAAVPSQSAQPNKADISMNHRLCLLGANSRHGPILNAAICSRLAVDGPQEQTDRGHRCAECSNSPGFGLTACVSVVVKG